MGYVIALFAVLVRLFRPTNGTHTSPFGYLRELSAELRRVRSGRVRRYVVSLPAADGRTGPALPPLVPAPRRPADDTPRAVLARVPADYVPVVDTDAVAEPADIVRGFYREHERKEALRRADASRLGLAVLSEIASSRTEVA
ncbi:hypothetical protein NE857_26815 [Nocardiopsis exhalans]|uniref:Uncharacterized protein n=1 Tax=Nocardiopsis exhalans TaxID=163604 RepID=A0ABY5D4E2_9ACTN|nr:hypothetical protein [Nocardiopsis exhalans]USY18855.1 hypothetical protein NE857_26815 [Nocardiopsis exhalans]